MSAALKERPPLFVDSPGQLGKAGAVRHAPDSPGGGRLTLEQKLDSVWEGLRADGAAECPVCGARMKLAEDRTGARCGGCGSHLG